MLAADALLSFVDMTRAGTDRRPDVSKPIMKADLVAVPVQD